MTFDILTLFPEAVESMLGISIIGRARKAGLLSVNCYQIRDYTEDKHRNVDDTPAGGGMGMVMAAQPIYDCYRDAVRNAPEGERRRVIYLSPRGRHPMRSPPSSRRVTASSCSAGTMRGSISASSTKWTPRRSPSAIMC